MRCDEVRGGGIGALAVVTAAEAIWEAMCEESGVGWVRAAVTGEDGSWCCDAAVVLPCLEGLDEESGEEGWGCWG